ncbi:MAG: hypothetical protein CVV27_17975 [Candidatus Melainabacteria bacterium HGW-Melainabacteria-1]|nr:MAG: hypothetical protein CVV27_17975 [Candidatus Melainabacteria bacterium HGW-Melainabacteria-1]
MTELFIGLAALALVQANGDPARIPMNPALALGQPESAFADETELVPHDPSQLESGWRIRVSQQSWFGSPKLTTRYRFSPAGVLQGIMVNADSCELIEPGLRQDLGEPEREGSSPQFLMSLRYASWQRDGVDFILEDFVPGCELLMFAAS